MPPEVFRWVGTLLGWLALVAVVLAVIGATGTVTRARLERFAQRQRLDITVDNGRQVMGYLATTRRWRVAGVLVGLVAGWLAAPFTRAPAVLDVGVVFAGWVIGALIAEVRVAHLEHGSIRAASLHPRRPERYVGRFAWALVPAAAMVAVAAGVVTAAAYGLGWISLDRVFAPMWLLIAVAVAVAVRWVQQAVLHRPQPLAAPDVIAADDAIRSRSLHVLSGAGAALVLLMTLNMLSAVGPQSIDAHRALDLARLLAPFPVALLGWAVAVVNRPAASSPVSDPA